MISRIFSKLGITLAVRWTLLTQGIRLLTGPLTMFLMVRYLSADCQGYAYTFSSVLGISIFLEMGFSQNILQFASHEYAKLEMGKDKSLSGDKVAYSRLISLGRLSFKYYGVASLLFFLVLLVGGTMFFSSEAHSHVSWKGPWMIACMVGSLSLLLNPCWAILEGCNQIAEVEKFRFITSVAGSIGLAIGLIYNLELYAVTIPSVLTVVISALYLGLRWRSFFRMFLVRPANGIISWFQEIWPFQWRIAVSWMSGYFIFSIITPVVFKLVSPQASGQVGFTLQLARLVGIVASSWSTTRLPEFGMLVARKNWCDLNQVWKKSAWMSVLITAFGCVAMILGMEVLKSFMPDLSGRYGGVLVAVFFSVSMVAQSLINSFAFYLRAFKEEPFMLLSVANAVLSVVSIAALSVFFGINGAAFGYMVSTLLILPFAWQIFRSKGEDFREARMAEVSY